jgi:2-dehydropantoate 2-reductase
MRLADVADAATLGGPGEAVKQGGVAMEPKRDTVAVVGAGALGTLLAMVLPRSGARIRVLARDDRRVATLTQEAPGAEATAEPSTLFPASLLFLCVKAYQTDDAAALLSRQGGDGAATQTPIVSLQNGWGHLERLEFRLPETPLVAGATTLGAYRDDGGVLRTSTAGGTQFAAWTAGAEHAAAAAARLFEAAGLRAEVVPDARDVLWRKLVLNVAVNPVAALHAVPNGALLEAPALHELAAGVAHEAVAVGAARGYLRGAYDPLPSLDALLRHTSDNRSSMTEDLARGRPTEADAILGAVIREGRAAGVPTPLAASLAARIAEAEARRRNARR